DRPGSRQQPLARIAEHHQGKPDRPQHAAGVAAAHRPTAESPDILTSTEPDEIIRRREASEQIGGGDQQYIFPQRHSACPPFRRNLRNRISLPRLCMDRSIKEVLIWHKSAEKQFSKRTELTS